MSTRPPFAPRARVARYTLALLLVVAWAGLAAGQEGPSLAGAVPAAVPEDAAIVAQLLGDQGLVGDPIARAERAEGRFQLTLPAEVDAELLAPEVLGCGHQAEMAMLPALSVLGAGERTLGGLWLTDVPADLWSANGPPKSTYYVYVAKPIAVRESCGGTTLDVDFMPGWNALTIRAAGGEYAFVGEAPPASFEWTFAASE